MQVRVGVRVRHPVPLGVAVCEKAKEEDRLQACDPQSVDVTLQVLVVFFEVEARLVQLVGRRADPIVVVIVRVGADLDVRRQAEEDPHEEDCGEDEGDERRAVPVIKQP